MLFADGEDLGVYFEQNIMLGFIMVENRDMNTGCKYSEVNSWLVEALRLK